MRNPDCSLKVEVSAHEPLLTEPVERHILHEFAGESLDGTTITAYRLEEVVAEKLRALLQSRQHREIHGWVRNRPRDLYDLWHLWHQDDFTIDWAEVQRILPAKAKAYDVGYNGTEDFLDEQVLEGIRRDWLARLGSFVSDLPPFESCIATLRAILGKVVVNEGRRQ
jgi:predicted nucleotidyltransferase component of viral defense system